MKRYLLPAVLFLAGAVLAYLAMSTLIPGWKVKLAAPPMEVFAANLRQMAGLKIPLSLAAGAVAAMIPRLSEKPYR